MPEASAVAVPVWQDGRAGPEVVAALSARRPDGLGPRRGRTRWPSVLREAVGGLA